ncbi:DUF262 domain-containing protein [Bacteroidales bacterium OttesenSCG-928-I14]|nr:DUF262 domain-containing protein [Bacteroidales bacterium OttesenSCG-928-I14]
MSILLNAEQQSLKKIFSTEEEYLIPSYQRPYSWEYDQCFQLYNDLMNAFKEDEDYFIGNIILAKSTSSNDDVRLQVVDGQQRIISLWLLMKSLSLLYPEMKVLEKVLQIESWKGDTKQARIKSEIFEANDGIDLETIYKWEKKDFDKKLQEVLDKRNQIDERKCSGRIEANSMFFYNWLVAFNKNNDVDSGERFIAFLLTKVSLLPIILVGNNISEANAKALTIFETINNRGMNLEDADIFKARLYDKAKRENKDEEFIKSWVEFKGACNNLNLQVDDVFRYYSHIIRGQQGITVSEKKLRDFFISESFSPLNTIVDHEKIMNDLFNIIQILEYLKQEKTNTKSKVAIWLQIIDAYSNLYPQYAIVNYLYVNNILQNNLSDEEFEDFLIPLVRYIYYLGSTTTVKFEIYNIIKQTSAKKVIAKYTQETISNEHFSRLGRLKKGYALLSHYLKNNQVMINYSVDKIINNRDSFLFSKEEWSNIDLDTLGNFVIMDIAKKNISLENKKEYYQTSNFLSVRNIIEHDFFGREELLKRDTEIKNCLASFFKNEIWNL